MKLISLCLVALMAFPSHVLASSQLEPLLISFSVNGVSKGDIEVKFDSLTNDIYVDQSVMNLLGIKLNLGESVNLNSIESLKTKFDLSRLAVEVNTDGSLLESNQTFSLAGIKKFNYSPSVKGMYLNYGVNIKENSTDLNFDLGLSFDKHRFSSNAYCSEVCRIGQYSLVVDNDENLTQFRLGDFISESGYELIGFGFGKQYKLNPFFIRQPTTSYSSVANSSSKIELVVDGVTQFTKNVNPGRFSVEDIRQYSGRHNVQLNITDAFGVVSTISQDIFSSNSNLAKGLDEYSISAGALRAGADLNYRDFSVSGFYRKGISDYLTAGLNFRSTGESKNIGADYSYILPSGALLSGNLNVADDSSYRVSSTISDQNQANDLFWSLSGQFSKMHFKDAITASESDDKNSVLLANVSKRFGNYGANAGLLYESNQKESLSRFNFGVSSSLPQAIIGSLNANASIDNKGHYQVLFGVNISLDGGMGAALSVETNNGSLNNSQSFYKTTQDPREVSYRYSRSDTNGVSNQNLSVNKGFESSLVRADCAESYGKASCSAQLSGALVYTGDTGLLMTRPIRNSLLIVDGGIEGLEFGVNGNLIAKTNKNGFLVLPEVSPYVLSQVYLNSDSIPDGYTSQKASDNFLLRESGIGITSFGVKKVSAFFGKLEGKSSVNYILDGKINSFTSNNGEFYHENIEAGDHLITIDYTNKKTGNDLRDKCTFKTGVSNEIIEQITSISCVTNDR